MMILWFGFCECCNALFFFKSLSWWKIELVLRSPQWFKKLEVFISRCQLNQWSCPPLHPLLLTHKHTHTPYLWGIFSWFIFLNSLVFNWECQSLWTFWLIFHYPQNVVFSAYVDTETTTRKRDSVLPPQKFVFWFVAFFCFILIAVEHW